MTGDGLWARYARLVTRFRWPIVLAWAATAVTVLLVPAPASDAGGLDGFGSGNPAIAAELRSFEVFGFPLLSRVVLVQHDEQGLGTLTQAEAVLRALAINQGAYDTPLLGALPAPNTFELVPGSRQDGTTVLTYLFQDPRRSFSAQTAAAEQFAAEHLTDPDDAYVGVTGSIPARAAQAEIVGEELHVLELATVLAVLVIVGVTFRSVVAPLITLLTAGSAVVVTVGMSGRLAALLGVSVPPDLQPLIVALLLGVVTDYCIFFLSGLRRRTADGAGRLEAATGATREFAPIIAAAGVTVAAGTAALVVATSALFRGFGPAMALTVLIGLLVAITLVPALMALTGRWAFWPSRPAPQPVDQRPSRLTRLVTRRRSAALLAALACGLLTTAALPLRHLDLGLGFVQSLPAQEPVSRAAAAASAGFAPGILSPTELLLERDGLASERDALRELGRALDRQEGVAGVVGPGNAPEVGEFGIVLSPDGNAARYLLILDSAPLEAPAVQTLRQLQDRLPALLADAGLGDVDVGIAGDTALAEHIVAGTTRDLVRISIAALGVNLLMLMVFLRALVAPLYLLAVNVLALAATLGLTVWVFQDLLGQPGLTFYVPFAAAALLVALGSDYNIFAVGHIWSLAARRPLREAIVTTIPQTTAAITAAGAALAASFGLLAVVPLRPFRELAFALAVGILLDVLVVRTVLVPSLLTLVGPASGWPSARLRHDDGDGTWRSPDGAAVAGEGSPLAGTSAP